MFQSKNLTLIRERWHQFPHYYKPFRPYRITRDLTIMPGATLTIEKGVEVHVWPNVRILVLGNIVADGTYWEPIRFKPINTTEYDEIRGKIGTRYKRSSSFRLRNKRSDMGMRIQQWLRKKRADRADIVYQQFPLLFREDPYFQRFTVSLTSNGSFPGRSGFLQIHNATTGEIIPSCDRQFTIRNAQVVCRELGFSTMNVYHWLTPRWEYNPMINIIKTYMEPRECIGNEPTLDRCNLRLSGNTSSWQCMDNEHFNYIYCGQNKSLDRYHYNYHNFYQLLLLYSNYCFLSETPIGTLNIPYYSQGMLDICASNKIFEFTNRILIYYKYDSRPVDCVKIFSSRGRKVAFRFLQVWLFIFSWLNHSLENLCQYSFHLPILSLNNNISQWFKKLLSRFDMGSIDARLNYWGYPGTEGVAAGKIRDYADYPYLIKLDAFVPYMRADDIRQKELARRIDVISQNYITEPERYSAFGVNFEDTHVWISSVSIPFTQCGWLSARTGKMGTVNCNNLIPFICEKGTQPYVEPIMWRTGIIIAVIVIGVLLALLFLLALCWCIKSRRREEETIERKNIIRASIKLQRFGGLRNGNTHESTHASLQSSTINAYGDPFTAHRAKTAYSSDTYSAETGSYTTERSHDYSEGYYSCKVPRRNAVCSNPNPYAEIPTMNTFQSPNKKVAVRSGEHTGVRLRDQRSYTSCSTTTPTSCSTCLTESEHDSTLTEGSWSERSSTVSENTMQNKRLIPPKSDPPNRNVPSPNDYLRGSGHFQKLAPCRSNPNLQGLGNPRSVDPPRIPTISPHRPAPSPPSYKQTGYCADVPPSVPSRSLVNLYHPQQSPDRRNSEDWNRFGRKPMVETSM
uniref:SRCR domain-containing protein n=1 Tax=Heterorhabditis bacteriophora TaxID=37862 RepID=A0A1I7XKS0_HETBA